MANPEVDAGDTAGIRRLHICPECTSDYVHIFDWDELIEDEGGDPSNDVWEVTLRCGECFWMGSVYASEDEMDALDSEISNAQVAMYSLANAIHNYNAERSIEGFARALEADAILPEDF